MNTSIDSRPPFTVRIANGLLGITPLFDFAKQRARNMMIQRAQTIGVQWREEAQQLQSLDWSQTFAAINNPDLQYPDYYLKPFHAYTEGNLGWEPATEVEVAAYSVHARVWEDGGFEGDPRLRQSYHDILKQELSQAPQDIVDLDIVDLGCSVGMSTFALQDTFPGSRITGVDLSPYFLSVAQYRTELRQAGQGNRLQLQETAPSTQPKPTWVHAAAEATGLPSASYDLVSASLMFHELPRDAAQAIFREAKRLLKPGGHFALMDMNPRSSVYAKMPPYVLTLLKSTEPHMDDYFNFDIETAIAQSGFSTPKLTCNTPRHRTIIAQAIIA
jgi:ubiquinone/menaquinone biosynthesis C-methylase UbiE